MRWRGTATNSGWRRCGWLTVCWLAIFLRLSPLVAAIGVVGASLMGGAVSNEIVDGVRGRPNFAATMHVLAMAVLTADGIIGAVMLVRRVRSGRMLARRLERRTVSPSAKLMRAAAEIASMTQVLQIDDPDCTAFTYGVLRPRIVVTSALVDRLSDRQLLAVLAHEKAHVEASDPLRLLAVASFSRGLLHAPALPPLLRCHLRRRELAADRAAVRIAGRAALAQALLMVLGPPRVAGAVVAPLGDEDSLLRARILQLETGKVVRPELNRWQMLGSLPAVLLFIGIAFTCGH